MDYYIGIDAGSTTTEAIILDDTGEIADSFIISTGASIPVTVEKCWKRLGESLQGHTDEIRRTIATGYGRKQVGFADRALTEITAHALGAMYYYPAAATVIDIGGQDTKVIRIDPGRNVVDFAMNDKCAAGTGRFLEVMARTLEMNPDEMADMAYTSQNPAGITSTCTVFIESEIISLIAENVPVSDIAAGVFNSIAGRIASMVKGVKGASPYVLSGGVAKNRGIVNALASILVAEMQVPEEPQLIGALGAALYGMGWTKGA